jgi:hypothetical protein
MVALIQKLARAAHKKKRKKVWDRPPCRKAAMFNKHMVLTRAPFHGALELP